MFDFMRRSMMARILAVSAVALVTGGSQVRCSSGDTSLIDTPPRDIGGGDGPTFTTTLVLRNPAGQETYRFARGESITFELTVRNRTDQTVNLDFASGHQWEFHAFASGAARPLWYWSRDVLFIQATTRLSFAPREARVFTVTWNQVAHNGESLTAGRYEARGALLFPGLSQDPLTPHELGSTLREFTVF